MAACPAAPAAPWHTRHMHMQGGGPPALPAALLCKLTDELCRRHSAQNVCLITCAFASAKTSLPRISAAHGAGVCRQPAASWLLTLLPLTFMLVPRHCFPTAAPTPRSRGLFCLSFMLVLSGRVYAAGEPWAKAKVYMKSDMEVITQCTARPNLLGTSGEFPDPRAIAMAAALVLLHAPRCDANVPVIAGPLRQGKIMPALWR